jgi:hypothetical protein
MMRAAQRAFRSGSRPQCIRALTCRHDRLIVGSVYAFCFSGRERADATGAVRAETSCSEVFRRVSGRDRCTAGQVAAAISAAPIPLAHTAARGGRDRGIARRLAISPASQSRQQERKSRSGFGSWVPPHDLPTTTNILPEFAGRRWRSMRDPVVSVPRCVYYD